MRLLRRFNEILSRLDKAEIPDNSFIFPYSADKALKRQQLWANLQRGLLFEDQEILVPWLTPFNQIGNFKEKRNDRGDRTQWYLGKRKILDGYEGHFEVMKWMWLPWTNPITKISENIGDDYEGMKRFHYLKDYLTGLLGTPAKTDLEKFGAFDLGLIQWQNGAVKVSLLGIEHFNCRYSFSIGLVKNSHQEYFDNQIEEHKAGGQAGEEPGK